jgi:hypothetical protein
MTAVSEKNSIFSPTTLWLLAGVGVLGGGAYWQRANIGRLIAPIGEKIVVWVAKTDAFRKRAGPLLASEAYRPHVKKMLAAEIRSALKAIFIIPSYLLQFGSLTI